MHEHVDASGAVRDRTAEPDLPAVRDVPVESDHPGYVGVVFGSRDNPSHH